MKARMHPKPTSSVVEFVLSDGTITLIDAEDLARVSAYTWCLSKTKCGQIRAFRHKSKDNPYWLLHRFILSAPDGVVIDHKDGDTLNNTKSNLRICTQAENSRNRRRSKRNVSGYKGVIYEARINRWRAQIAYDGRAVVIGRYKTAERAARAYDRIARLCHGDFARTNF